MKCKHLEMRPFHPTSSSCIYFGYCTIYERYCLGTEDCKTNLKEGAKKCQQSKQLSQRSMAQTIH